MGEDGLRAFVFVTQVIEGSQHPLGGDRPEAHADDARQREREHKLPNGLLGGGKGG